MLVQANGIPRLKSNGHFRLKNRAIDHTCFDSPALHNRNFTSYRITPVAVEADSREELIVTTPDNTSLGSRRRRPISLSTRRGS